MNSPNSKCSKLIQKLIFARLKLTILGCEFPILSKGPNTLYLGSFSHQICQDLRGVQNSRKMGRDPPIGGPEQCLILSGTPSIWGSEAIFTLLGADSDGDGAENKLSMHGKGKGKNNI